MNKNKDPEDQSSRVLAIMRKKFDDAKDGTVTLVGSISGKMSDLVNDGRQVFGSKDVATDVRLPILSLASVLVLHLM